MPFTPRKTRSSYDAAATSAQNAAGKMPPSATPSVSSAVGTPQVPTLLTYIYIYINIYTYI